MQFYVHFNTCSLWPLAAIVFHHTPRHTHPLTSAMIASIGHIFLLEVVNVYCMVPLIWRSVLNAPLFAVFHLVIAINGECGVLPLFELNYALSCWV